MATPVSFNPATYSSTVEAPFTSGARYTYVGDGREYRYLRIRTAVAADGVVVCWYDATTYDVIGVNRTTALSGTPVALLCVAVAVGAVAINSWGFFLTKGLHTNVLSTGSTLGRAQCASGTNDTCTDASASLARTEVVIGYARTSTSGGRCTVEVNL